MSTVPMTDEQMADAVLDGLVDVFRFKIGDRVKWERRPCVIVGMLEAPNDDLIDIESLEPGQNWRRTVLDVELDYAH